MATRRQLGGAGNDGNTAAIAFGGDSPPTTANTEVWNGSNWTEVNNLNTARKELGGAGITTSALAYGGSPTPAATELWNGTNWVKKVV